eukprot:CAMPEP_0201526494 /NCGR_PEP_ID=MMETSP0161_2-20130828/31983_1 /ASSEMBLY_ACC=CAM_ASM_000251 /TAXON_ID=180227 /ORGANISM="Neoparamoeba aestuarina, Strain SoJaBio B1-5/56/2" /LENGTH=729 /DNA_ID=CAMNT_0047926913 /DNA_START=101 /DNA_END=2290 /DNA_ORIENTATION=+
MADTTDVDDWLDEFESNESSGGGSAGDLASEDEQGEKSFDVEKILSNFMHPSRGVEVKDRKFRLKTYKNCFVGQMAIEWLCKFLGVTKEEALGIGMQMYERNYIVHVVEKDKGFLNDYLFYNFTNTAETVYKASEVYAAEMKVQKERLARSPETFLIDMMDSRKGIDIRDRKYMLKWYKRCFVGEEAVQWFRRYFRLSNSDEDTQIAISKGQQLKEAGYIIHTVDAEKPFLDGYFFYLFTPSARQIEAKVLRSLTTAVKPQSSAELAQRLFDPLSGVYLRDHKRLMKTYKQCCSGSDIVDWIIKNLRVRSRSHAVKLSEKLLKDNFIAPVAGNVDAPFQDSSKELYKFCGMPENMSLHLTKQQVPDDDIGVESFDFNLVLGVGGFGTVYLAKKKDDERYYAIKAIRKSRFRSHKEIESLILESEVLRNDHPYLLHLYWAFTSKDFIYLVLDYIGGGDLFHHLQAHKTGFSRNTVQFFAAQVLLGLGHLHGCGIIYRDMKLENILLDTDGNVCLADFGLSKILNGADDRATTMCGTPGYVAPEVLLGKGYGTQVDLWSLGVLMYELSTGRNPFLGKDRNQTFMKILKFDPQFPEQFFSKKAVSLIKALLTKDPNMRPQKVEDIKGHPYFKNIDWTKLLLKQIPSPFEVVVDGEGDTQNFDAEFTNIRIRIEDNSPIHDADAAPQGGEGNGIDVRWSRFKLAEPDAVHSIGKDEEEDPHLSGSRGSMGSQG